MAGVLSTRAGELWHESAGEGSRVLLLHAGICDSRMWEPQWRSFPARHETIRCDLRGYGRTPLPAEPFSNARDVIALLEGPGKGPAALVGASVGGRVALEVALARPELVERLVLVAPGLPDHEWSESAERYGEAEYAALERGDIDAAVEENLRMWVDGPRRQPGEVDPALRSLVGEMQRLAFELQLPVGDDADETLLVPDTGARAGDLEVPALVIVGDEDVGDMHAIAERLAVAIPDAELARIPGASHLPSLERPDEFDRLALAFLDAG